MFDLFKKKPTRCLGLDIGTASLKMVEIVKQSDGDYLKNYALLDLFLSSSGEALPNCVSTDTMSEQSLIEITKSFLKKADLATNQVAVSVPVFSSFFTMMSLPVMPPAELEAAIRSEAKKYVPLPLEEFDLDWLVNNPRGAEKNSATGAIAPANPDQRLDILLIAVPKELIQRINRIVAGLGLKLVSLEAENFSLIRALQPQMNALAKELVKPATPLTPATAIPKINALVIDAGARASNLVLLENNLVRLVHIIDYSGNQVSNLLSDKAHIGFNEAEVAKRAGGVSAVPGPSQIGLIGNANNEALKNLFSRVVNEIKSVISSDQIVINAVTQPLTKPDFCLLAGGAVSLTSFYNYLKANLDVPVFQANPFYNLKMPINLKDQLTSFSPIMSVAVGLALR